MPKAEAGTNGRPGPGVLISEFRKTRGRPATTPVCRAPGSRHCVLGRSGHISYV